MHAVRASQRFSLRFYFQALSGLLRDPGGFYAGLPEAMGPGPALGCLLLSSLIFTLASLMNTVLDTLTAGAIFLTNAVGMSVISAGLGFAATLMTTGRRLRFSRFFTIYALASGVTLLAAWMPYFLVITEPWKWWLIFLGLTRGLGLKRGEALTVVGLSIGILVLVFWTCIPLIASR